MSSEDQVKEASAKFYAALNSMMEGDATPMADVWAHGARVTTMHPIAGRQVGWIEVEASFKGVAEMASGGRVRLRDQHIEAGNDMAYEVGVEEGEIALGGERVAIEHRVTNVYRRENGAWRLVHHHTDVSPQMVDAIARLPMRPAATPARAPHRPEAH